MERPRRPTRRRTQVCYGPIGSGDKLMKCAQQRNELRDRYHIIGLEMEAAGTMNQIPVGVIRGVCDYGDERKSKEWQPYAAAMAAAYAKAILSEIPPRTQHGGARPDKTTGTYEIHVKKRNFNEYLGVSTHVVNEGSNTSYADDRFQIPRQQLNCHDFPSGRTRRGSSTQSPTFGNI
ncbi:hypothetical protein NW762_008135 [Fusarium torreyae]|uniref:Nucleoside phosphorylase domain-containing protein n=1 Tax=Fusarium torreyae TaxID=1237075 RepID=A0A9W8RY65_9HYPO|nr:hypothetical protein NW762_008135 [Fusarium torreyae]